MKTGSTSTSVKITCPRCKETMSAARASAGSYVHCAHCEGRFWMPNDLANEPSQDERTPNRSQPPEKTTPRKPDKSAPEPPEQSTPKPPEKPALKEPERPTPLSAKKVARFVNGEAVKSSLNLTETGELPDLHLDDSEQEAPREAKGPTVNPLVLLGLLCLSIVASLVLVMADSRPASPLQSRERERARFIIAEDYFADDVHVNLPNPPPLEPYQVMLREARRAHARGDNATERKLHRRVLNLLRAETTGVGGVTGTRARDQELERLLILLLSRS